MRKADLKKNHVPFDERVREELSAQFNFDVKAIFNDIRRRQASLGDRLLRQPQDRKTEPADVHDRPGGRSSA